MRFSIRASILATSELHISAPHPDTQPRGCRMRPGYSSDDITWRETLQQRIDHARGRVRRRHRYRARPDTHIGLAPIRTFVDHLVEYSHIPRPWDDARGRRWANYLIEGCTPTARNSRHRNRWRVICAP